MGKKGGLLNKKKRALKSLLITLFTYQQTTLFVLT